MSSTILLDALRRHTTLRSMLRTRGRIAAVVLWAMLAPRVLTAQGSVSGRVTIQERERETTKDLATAVIYLETAGGAIGPTRELETEIGMHDKTYVPHVRVVPAGSTVIFPNQDPFRHNVFSNSTAGPFDLGLTPRGRSSRNAFRRPGVYAIYCNIHARMSAFVVAVATPYYTQPGADGTFTLAAVPAGRYLLHAWHERGGETTQTLEVPPTGLEGLVAVLDARGYRPAQHKNKFGLDYEASDEDERY
jgi:plastocyanin